MAQAEPPIAKQLRAHPAATTITELQTQLDTFTELYNHHRPHRSLPQHCTPAVAYTIRPETQVPTTIRT